MSRKLEKSILSRDEISLLLNSETPKNKELCGNLYDVLLKLKNFSTQKLKATSMDDLERYGIDNKAKSVLTYNKNNFFSIVLNEWYAEQKIEEDPSKKSRCELCNTPNKYLFYIRNTENNISLNVGSSCIKKFPGIEGYVEAHKRLNNIIKKQQELSRMYKFKEKFPDAENIIESVKSYFNTLPILLPEKLYCDLRDLSNRMQSIYSKYVYEGKTPYKTILSSFDLFELQMQNFNKLKTDADDFINKNINKPNMCKRREIDWLLNNDKEKVILQISQNNGKYTLNTIANIFSNEFINDNLKIFINNNLSQTFKIKGVDPKTHKFIFEFNKFGYTPPLMFYVSYKDFMKLIGNQCIINNQQYSNMEIIKMISILPSKNNLKSIIRYTYNMMYELYYEFLFSSDKNILMVYRKVDGAITIISHIKFMEIYQSLILIPDREIKNKLKNMIKQYKNWISISEQHRLGYENIIKQIRENNEFEYTFIKKHSSYVQNCIEIPFYKFSNGNIDPYVDFIKVPKNNLMISREKYFLIDFATNVNTYEMEPKIKFGDIVFIHKTKKIQEDDIVIFERHGNIHIAIYKIDKKRELTFFSPINKSKDEIINSKKIHVIGKIMCWNSPKNQKAVEVQ